MSANPEFLGSLDASEGEVATPPESVGEDRAPAESPQQPEGAPEIPAEPKTEEPKEPKEPKETTVPLAALHEARNELKQLRAKIAELEARPALNAEQQAALDKLKATEKATEEAEPDFLADPKGYVDAKVAAALRKLEGTEKETKETKAQLQQQEQLRQVLTQTAAMEAEFSQQTPDYTQALQHARNVRIQQMQMMYPQATQQQIAQAIWAEEVQIAHQLLAAGQNPAEFAYNYAKTLGYQPQKPAGKQEQKKPDKDAARSLGSGGGGDEPPETEESNLPEFTAALAERFKRKK